MDCLRVRAADGHLPLLARDRHAYRGPVIMRAMAARDVEWAALVMDQRRQADARYSPVFWRPARDAAGVHARLLARQIAAPQFIALRTDDGFLIAELRGPEVLIDDFAVTGEDRCLAMASRHPCTADATARYPLAQ